MNTIRATLTDAQYYLAACADQRATDDERNDLSTAASLIHAGEPLPRDLYSRCERLTGGMLSREGPISLRPMPAAQAPA